MNRIAFSLLILILALALPSCSRKTPPASDSNSAPDPAAASPSASDQTPAAASPRGTAPSSTPNESIAGAVDPFMTGQLRIFINEKGRMPSDFGEFARARMDSVPRLPKGMKYVIDPTTQEIKVAREK